MTSDLRILPADNGMEKSHLCLLVCGSFLRPCASLCQSPTAPACCANIYLSSSTVHTKLFYLTSFQGLYSADSYFLYKLRLCRVFFPKRPFVRGGGCHHEKQQTARFITRLKFIPLGVFLWSTSLDLIHFN